MRIFSLSSLGVRCTRSAVSAWSLVSVATLALPGVAMAEPVALVQGPAAVITTADIEADVQQRIPAEVRASVLSRPQSVQQIAGNLYVRRAMAEKAHSLKLDTGEAVQTALRLARDKVLSDVYLASIDEAHAVPQAAAEAQARSVYRAKPERFKEPEQVQVRHILLEGNTPEVQKRAQALLQELRNGADFAQLAKENSADQGSAAKGGELGFFARGRMAPEFEKAAFELNTAGELSSVVETQFGLHILQLQERRAAGRLTPFEEVKNALVQEIRDSVTNQARVKEADAIRAQAQPQTAAIEAFSSVYADADRAATAPKSNP